MTMMNNNNWDKAFERAPIALENAQSINKVATAFNTCIDAVIKITPQKFLSLLAQEDMSLNELEDIKVTKINSNKDVLKGIFKCFKNGIAEEWITEDKSIYNWMQTNISYDKLQMGGQAGIVANALALSGVKEVVAHASSLPKDQAQLFLSLNNLYSFDQDGKKQIAHNINRATDDAMIHWIIEFDKDDVISIDGKDFTCPKSNRFIATYDPLNLNLATDKNFIDYINKENIDLIFLSGYHSLTKENDGTNLINQSFAMLKAAKKDALIHLEVASTQDLEVRKAIINNLNTVADSIGINERETLDILEALGFDELKEKCEQNLNAINLYEAIVTIKKALKIKRVALHFFGMYITLSDENFKLSAQKTKDGMVLASIVSSSKASVGSLDKKEDMLFAKNQRPNEFSLTELNNLATHINKQELFEDGICKVDDFYVIAVPTIIVKKPKTLVGMGDTISSISLIGSL